MVLSDFFYCVCWINFILMILFFTDAVYSYLDLFNLCKKTQADYACTLIEYPELTFIKYLNHKSKTTSNRYVRFLLKATSCPMCLTAWLCIASCLYYNSLICIAPLYITSIALFLILKKLF